MRLLLIAASPMEFRFCTTAPLQEQPDQGVRLCGAEWHSARRFGVPSGPVAGACAVDWARTIRLGSHDVLAVANGAGARRAASALDAAAAVFQPDAVVSTGFCGALDPQLHVADVVMATSVAAADRTYEALPVSTTAAYHSGVVCSIDRVAQTADEKRRLRAGGGIAVEMEAAGVAARAEARGLPFYCIRVVTDLAGDTMANDFNAALRADGHFDTMVILREALRRPLARLPELCRLRQRSVRAACVLGDFLADCRF